MPESASSKEGDVSSPQWSRRATINSTAFQRASPAFQRASSFYASAMSDDEKWVEMEYSAFFDRYSAILPPEEAKLRRSLEDWDSLGLRPVPFRRLAELLVVALWRVHGRGGSFGTQTLERSSSGKLRMSTGGPSKTSEAIRKSMEVVSRLSLAEVEEEGLDEGLLKPYGPNASRLRLGETTVTCHALDVALWDECLRRREAEEDLAVTRLAAVWRARSWRLLVDAA